MPRPNARARFRFDARKPPVRARIGKLLLACADGPEHISPVSDHHSSIAGRKMPLLPRRRLAVFDGPSLRLPLGKSAIENGDVVLAEHPEHPPGARCRVEAKSVVKDYFFAVAHAHLAH